MCKWHDKAQSSPAGTVPALPPVNGVNARTVLAGKGSLRRAGARPCPLRAGAGDSRPATGGSGGNSSDSAHSVASSAADNDEKLLTGVGLLMEVPPGEPLARARTFVSQLYCQRLAGVTTD